MEPLLNVPKDFSTLQLSSQIRAHGEIPIEVKT